MGDKTEIIWTDATWNPIRGCRRVSPGCENCYAEKVAHRFSGPGKPYEGLTTARGRWNGEVMKVPAVLDQPIRWQRPRMIFVNSMSDLFHERLDFEYIAAVFGVMAAAKHHTFQVLTKRADRMIEFFDWIGEADIPSATCARHAQNVIDDPRMKATLNGAALNWPLNNVWLGVSAEDQERADERIPKLLRCPAAVHWISAEPLIGPIDLADHPGLGWVVVGGESGPGSREMRLDWARKMVRQCQEADVPVMVKQLGAKPMEWEGNHLGKWLSRHVTRHKKGGEMSEWPEDLRVRQYPPTAARASAA